MTLPINESAVKKAHLAEWISEGITIMNEKKRDKVVHCWGKTGLLAIWDVNERAVLAPEAFSQTARLFPGHNNDDNSGLGNEVDDSAPEKSADFSSATTINVDSETGVVTSKEAEEEAEIEEQLVAAVVAHAQSSVVPAVEALPTGKLLLQDSVCCALVTILCVADVSGGAGGVDGDGAGAGAGEGARGLTRVGVRARGRGRGQGRGRGSAAPAARAPHPNRTRTREVRPAARLDD